jgi:hypothetical protein
MGSHWKDNTPNDLLCDIDQVLACKCSATPYIKRSPIKILYNILHLTRDVGVKLPFLSLIAFNHITIGIRIYKLVLK